MEFGVNMLMEVPCTKQREIKQIGKGYLNRSSSIDIIYVQLLEHLNTSER